MRDLYPSPAPLSKEARSGWREDVRAYATRLAFDAAAVGETIEAAKERAMIAAKQAPYLEPTQASGRALVQRAGKREVVMLNLLRFREVADYSANPEPEPHRSVDRRLTTAVLLFLCRT